jgi:sterol desaturase/sphingolipid hydroxylase (fatty acid hydroxylase superfamily)
MKALQFIYNELISFFGIEKWLEIFRTGNYSSLLTWHGFSGALGPVIPLLLLIEIIRGIIYKRVSFHHYRVPFFIYIFNRFVAQFISIAAVTFSIGFFAKWAVFKTHISWYWLIYGYIIWELSHFVYHYLGHKVRIFWCLHSTHHAPEAMNLSVTYAHFFLEAPYADIIRTSICILLGVDPPLLFIIMFIDGLWGAFIHIGDNILKDARLGFLKHIILTPSHHRVHHARNPLYMDTNFCNLLNIWDRLFGTWQPEREEIKIEYGITRPINPDNFLDVYFGEFLVLWNDIKKTPGFKNKVLYLVKPPGWTPVDDQKTARAIRRAFMGKLQQNKI